MLTLLIIVLSGVILYFILRPPLQFPLNPVFREENLPDLENEENEEDEDSEPLQTEGTQGKPEAGGK